MKIYLKKKDNKYIIIKEGAKRASKSFDSYAEAKSYAEKTASDLKATLIDEANPVAASVKKAVKKPKVRKIIIILAIILFIALVVIVILNKDKILKPNEPSPSTNPTISSTLPNNSSSLPSSSSSYSSSTGSDTDQIAGFVDKNIIYDDFQIHFMMLGNDKAGDSIYIKAGDTDILIDAGSRSSSATTTIEYMKKYITDGKIEYVIMTHGDQDHIEAFPNILKVFQAENIIYNQYTSKTTATYQNTIAAFEEQKEKGANIYYAGDCFNQTNGAKKSYKLSDNVTMDILYNKYYFEKGYTSSTVPSGFENNYSVCTMFTYEFNGTKNYYMLTGDLEEKGEMAMAEYYDKSTPEKTLPEVLLFKAGHHGSKTSSNECLLSLIKPKICIVSCCCGTDEYTGVTDNQFPTQDFITRIAKYTDDVYVTTIYDTYEIKTAVDKGNGKSDKTGIAIGGNYISTSGYKAMNGNIIVSANESKYGIWASNNLIKLKDSEWLNTKITIDGVERQIRTWPN